ncbi:MAG: phosphatase PAP2 family protein [Pseudobdellovibrio sp.]
MNYIIQKIFLLVVLSLNLLACNTTKTAPTITSQTKNTYLSADLYNEFKKQIPDFPSEGSPAQAADEAQLRMLQKSRTKTDCERANTEVEVTLQSLYGKPYGPLTAQQVTALQPLIKHIREESGPYIGQIKNSFNRPRPYDYLSDLKPCLPKEQSLAYPSGHATLAALYGIVLSDLLPKNKIELEKRAEQIGLDRILGGVHHPSDVLFGKKLGLLIYAELKKSITYNDDIEAYKKSLN